ncbi:MAG: tetratricopeptide repeat protein [Myxococcaceae bacterium]
MGLARPLNDRDEKDRAHALMLKGRVEQAIAIYRGLVTRNARDASMWLLLGDAQRKVGQLDHAVRAYHTAARQFADQGHVARARAAIAVALRIAPGEPTLLEELRGLRPQPVSRHLALVPPPVATPAPAVKPVVKATPPAYPLDAKKAVKALPARPAPRPPTIAKPPPPVPPLVEEDIDQVLEVGFLDLLGDLEGDDEMKTEVFCPLFDWLEETPDSGPHVFPGAQMSKHTVLARPQRRR